MRVHKPAVRAGPVQAGLEPVGPHKPVVQAVRALVEPAGLHQPVVQAVLTLLAAVAYSRAALLEPVA